MRTLTDCPVAMFAENEEGSKFDEILHKRTKFQSLCFSLAQ